MSARPRIPVAAPHLESAWLRDSVVDAIRQVVDGTQYINGPCVAAFEAEFAAHIGGRYAIGCASGTDAITLALMAAGIGSGDEVIIPSHSASATAVAVVRAGAKPVFADIEPDTWCLDPDDVARVHTVRTRALLPVHIYGHPADVSRLQAFAAEHNAVMVEDCAQAVGAAVAGRAVGTFGVAGAFSFYPTKNLGAIGDGGCVVTSDASIAERVRVRREYGWRDRYIAATSGINSRLDEIQAAVLGVKLRHLGELNRRRVAIAERYLSSLANPAIELPAVRSGCSHAWHLFVIQCASRDALRRHLDDCGIGTGLHYPVPIHRQPAFTDTRPLPVTEALYGRLLTLPLHPFMEPGETDRVIDAVNAWRMP